MQVLSWCEHQCCGDPKYQHCCQDELQTGAIVGIVFGVIAFIIIFVVLVLLLYCCWYKKRDTGYKERSFARYSEPPVSKEPVGNPPQYTPHDKAYSVEDEVKTQPKPNDYEAYKTKQPQKTYPKHDDYDDEEDEDFDDYDEYDDYKTEPRNERPENKRKSTRNTEEDGQDTKYLSELKTKLRHSKHRYGVDDEDDHKSEPPRSGNNDYRPSHQGGVDLQFGNPNRGFKHSQSSV